MKNLFLIRHASEDVSGKYTIRDSSYKIRCLSEKLIDISSDKLNVIYSPEHLSTLTADQLILNFRQKNSFYSFPKNIFKEDPYKKNHSIKLCRKFTATYYGLSHYGLCPKQENKSGFGPQLGTSQMLPYFFNLARKLNCDVMHKKYSDYEGHEKYFEKQNSFTNRDNSSKPVLKLITDVFDHLDYLCQ